MMNAVKMIIIYPTDTVYGLGCSIFDYDSVNKIYKIKGKSFKENLSFLVNSVEEISEYAEITSREFNKIKDLLKKGSNYTFCLRKRNDFNSNVSHNGEIGIRVIKNNAIKGLIIKFGPFVTTSANVHGQNAPKNIKEVSNKIIKSAKLIVKGTCYYGKPSIVYDLINDRIKRG